MTTIVKITLKDDYTDQHLTIKHQLGGPQLDHYVEVFRAFLLVAGFDQDLVNERLKIE